MKTSTGVTKETQGTIYITEFHIFVWINNSVTDWFNSATDAHILIQKAPNGVQSF